MSESDRKLMLAEAKKVSSEIRDWVGDAEREKVGLGQNCNASWYLKATDNKRASYPFDWIFTTPEFILDMLGDDFEKLLDRKQLIRHGMDAGHEYYHEWLFGHRNPATSDGDYAFLERCVDRWNKLMHAQKPVIFLTVVLNESGKRKRWKEGFTKNFKMPTDQSLSDFNGVIEKILSLNPKSKFLFIEQYTEEPFELSILEKTESVLWLKFCAIGSNTGVQYLNAVDDEVMKSILKDLP